MYIRQNIPYHFSLLHQLKYKSINKAHSFINNQIDSNYNYHVLFLQPRQYRDNFFEEIYKKNEEESHTQHLISVVHTYLRTVYFDHEQNINNCLRIRNQTPFQQTGALKTLLLTKDSNNIISPLITYLK